MLLRLQGKPRAENQWVNRLTIERNRAENQEDTTKKPTVCNNYAIEIS